MPFNFFCSEFLFYICSPLAEYRRVKDGPVAQLNRVTDYGSVGFRFES